MSAASAGPAAWGRDGRIPKSTSPSLEARAALPDLRRRLLRIQDLLAEARSRQQREGGAEKSSCAATAKGRC